MCVWGGLRVSVIGRDPIEERNNCYHGVSVPEGEAKCSLHDLFVPVTKLSQVRVFARVCFVQENEQHQMNEVPEPAFTDCVCRLSLNLIDSTRPL